MSAFDIGMLFIVLGGIAWMLGSIQTSLSRIQKLLTEIRDK